MRLNRLFFPLLLILFWGFGQDVSGQTSSTVAIMYTPLSLIDPYGSNVQFGAELIRGKWSYGSDLAFYLSKSSEDGDYRFADRKGFKIRPEIRYYFEPRLDDEKPHLGFYVAGELLFVRDHYKRGDTFIKDFGSDDPDNLFFDYDIISRYELGFNIKIAYTSILWKRLTLDWFTGMGIKYINSQFEYRVPFEHCCPVIRFFEPPTGKGFRPWLTFGLKLGIMI